MKHLDNSSEHTIYDPTNKVTIDDYISDIYKKGYVYVGYAWFNESGKWDGTEVPVAFIIGPKNKHYLTVDPCWNWIKKERTAEQQQWIEDNWDAIVDCWDL